MGKDLHTKFCDGITYDNILEIARMVSNKDGLNNGPFH